MAAMRELPQDAQKRLPALIELEQCGQRWPGFDPERLTLLIAGPQSHVPFAGTFPYQPVIDASYPFGVFFKAPGPGKREPLDLI
jgi:hypothetical protein